VAHTIPMSAHRRAEPASDFDQRIISLIEAAYLDRTDLFHLALLAYDTFCTVRPPLPMIPNLQPNLFLSFTQARTLEAIVQRALVRDPAEQFSSPREFGDALLRAFGPYLIEAPVASEELILLGDFRANAPFPAVLATDGVHAIDLLIEDPSRRIVARADWEAIHLLDALRDCVLRRVPILIDTESARFPHPSLCGHRPITEIDIDLLRALCPLADSWCW
jgi:hypothetical protein